MAEPGAAAFVAFVAAQRLAELAIARRNTRRLLAEGAREAAAAHYPLLVAVHAGWLAALAAFGLGQPVSAPWLAAYALLTALRVWVMASLGRRWTTRVIVAPEPPVRRGPYRHFAHPNYAVASGEILVAPLVLGLPWVAALFTLLNAAALRLRIAAEDRALGRR